MVAALGLQGCNSPPQDPYPNPAGSNGRVGDIAVTLEDGTLLEGTGERIDLGPVSQEGPSVRGIFVRNVGTGTLCGEPPWTTPQSAFVADIGEDRWRVDSGWCMEPSGDVGDDPLRIDVTIDLRSGIPEGEFRLPNDSFSTPEFSLELVAEPL